MQKRTGASFALAALAALAALSVLTACGAPGSAPDEGTPRPGTSTSTSTSAAPTARTGPAEPSTYSDFDGDGVGDLVITDPSAIVNGKSAGYVAVVHGSSEGAGSGRHQVITQDGLGLGKAGQGASFGTSTVSADLDGDGLADLVTQAGSNTVFVIWGWGGKDKLTGAARLAGSAPVTGDFDGDGHADLVTAGKEPSTATLSYGPFTRAGAPARTKSLDLAPDSTENPADGEGEGEGEGDSYYTARATGSGDMTGDGRDDLVVTWSHVFADEMPVPRATAVHRGAKDGLSAKGTRLKDAQGKDIFGSSTRTADVNKDGHADLIVGLSCEILGDVATPDGGSRVMVSYGGPDGVSTGPKPLTINERTPGLPGPPGALPVSSSCGFGHAVATGDVNADGYADVAFSAPTEDGKAAVLVLRGGPDGLTVKGAQSLPGFLEPPRVALVDLNGDRSAELAIKAGQTGGPSGKVRVLPGGASGVDTAAEPTLIGAADVGLTPSAPEDFGWDFGH